MLTIAILMTVFLGLIILGLLFITLDHLQSWGLEMIEKVIIILVLAFLSYGIVGTWILYCNIP
jgi:hypothetical protein